jgi:hypothetical protein
LREDAKGGIL